MGCSRSLVSGCCVFKGGDEIRHARSVRPTDVSATNRPHARLSLRPTREGVWNVAVDRYALADSAGDATATNVRGEGGAERPIEQRGPGSSAAPSNPSPGGAPFPRRRSDSVRQPERWVASAYVQATAGERKERADAARKRERNTRERARRSEARGDRMAARLQQNTAELHADAPANADTLIELDQEIEGDQLDG